jgi:hypothetical protein
VYSKREARQLAVHRGFVTLLVWVVVDVDDHDHDRYAAPSYEANAATTPSRPTGSSV